MTLDALAYDDEQLDMLADRRSPGGRLTLAERALQPLRIERLVPLRAEHP